MGFPLSLERMIDDLSAAADKFSQHVRSGLLHGFRSRWPPLEQTAFRPAASNRDDSEPDDISGVLASNHEVLPCKSLLSDVYDP
jgi:hypothetical protein